MNIVLCGFMGCGKSTVGKRLAEMLSMDFVDTDELIEAEQGTTISNIFSVHGEEYFRKLERLACEKLGESDRKVIATGGGALTFDENVKSLKKNGKIVFLDADFETLCERVGDAQTRPLFRDKEKAKTLFNERIEKYKNACDVQINANADIEEVARQIAELTEKDLQ